MRPIVSSRYASFSFFGVSSDKTKSLYSLCLQAIGEAPERDGLKKTPERFAKSMAVLTSGYRQSAEDIIKSALFDVDSDDLVTVGDIDFHSLCEHHMLPFYGKVC